MSQKTQQQLEEIVQQFNDAFDIGQFVEVTPYTGSEETFQDTITQPAFVFGGHTAVVMLKEKGMYDVEQVIRIVK